MLSILIIFFPRFPPSLYFQTAPKKSVNDLISAALQQPSTKSDGFSFSEGKWSNLQWKSYNWRTTVLLPRGPHVDHILGFQQNGNSFHVNSATWGDAWPQHDVTGVFLGFDRNWNHVQRRNYRLDKRMLCKQRMDCTDKF